MLKILVVALCLIHSSLLFANGHRHVPGDINGDGVVNFTDFLIMSQNFGLTGQPYDPNSRDTVRVETVVRDTIVQAIRDTVFFTHDLNFVANVGIRIDYDSHWTHDPDEIAWVASMVRDFFNEYFYAPIESNITLVYHPRQTGLKFERTNGGNHIILMNLTGNHAQTVDYFAHEYAHILGQHWNTRTGSHTWIEESLATTASTWVLWSLYNKLYDDPEYRKRWTYYRNGVDFGSLLIKQIPAYFEEVYPERSVKFTNEEFASRVRSSLSIMENDPYGDVARTAKFTAAYQLMPVFLRNPEAWNILRYMSPYGPISWNADQSFEDYMNGWRLRVPNRWAVHIAAVCQIFGVAR